MIGIRRLVPLAAAAVLVLAPALPAQTDGPNPFGQPRPELRDRVGGPGLHRHGLTGRGARAERRRVDLQRRGVRLERRGIRLQRRARADERRGERWERRGRWMQRHDRPRRGRVWERRGERLERRGEWRHRHI